MRSNRETAMEECYKTGRYSDLTIRCKSGREFKVHKIVVCSQSAYLAKAVDEGRFKEGVTGVIEFPADDNDEAVKAVFDFLYTGHYSVPNANPFSGGVYLAHPTTSTSPASTRSATRKSGRAVPTRGGFKAPTSTRTLSPSSRPPTAPTFDFELPHGTQHPLLFHLSVYEIADRIQQIDLRTLVETKIEEVAARSWSDLEFIDAVKIVYEVSPPGRHGDKLRKIVVKVAARHGNALYASESFKRIIRQVHEFSADLTEALCGQASMYPNQQMFHCPSANCAHRFSTEVPVGQQELSCPVCFVKADLDFWLPS